MCGIKMSGTLVVAALVTILAAADVFGATFHVTMSGDDAAAEQPRRRGKRFRRPSPSPEPEIPSSFTTACTQAT